MKWCWGQDWLANATNCESRLTGPLFLIFVFSIPCSQVQFGISCAAHVVRPISFIYDWTKDFQPCDDDFTAPKDPSPSLWKLWTPNIKNVFAKRHVICVRLLTTTRASTTTRWSWSVIFFFLIHLYIYIYIYIYCTSILPKFSFPKMKIGRFWVLTSMRPSRKSRRPAKLCGQVVTESWPWAALRRANVALRCEGVQETLVVVSSRQDIWLDQRGASNMPPICPACPACWLR